MRMQFPDCGILYIDDEAKSLKYFEAIFEDLAPVYIANSPAEGFEMFSQNHEKIGVVLCDKQMPEESGIELLHRIREVNSLPHRILVTAYSDLGDAVDSFNSGLLYSYLSKPWEPIELERRLTEALRNFTLERERDKLIEDKSEMIDQLLMADKVTSIGILSTGLNHHVRNALTVFRTFYDMLPIQLEEELGKPPKDKDFWGGFYDEVGSQIQRMTTMLSNLSDGSELGAVVDSEEFCLKETVEGAAKVVLGNSTDYRLTLRAGEDVPKMKGDHRRITQMLRILLQEAKTSLGASGEIEVEIVRRPSDNGIRLTIFDGGELIPEEDLKHLFEPFYVRSQRPEEIGSGFLACYLTVFSHGGMIRAYRSKTQQNAVEVCLPLAPPGKEQFEIMKQARERKLSESPNVFSKPPA